ncbi:MAG: choice-of-anchor Q domain-containing protein [Chitinophagales bacterium]
MKAIALLILSAVTLLSACRKDSFITSGDARITITVDTLKYDTVFPTTGSISQFFKIVNENNQSLRLSSVKLMGGTASAFKVNVDGISTSEATNIDIEANDSVYVYVQVNVDPTAANLPFVIRDSIQVTYNGNKRLVQLEAWGQNAHFFRNKEITTDEIWNNDLPYVILGYLRVNASKKLTINKGCRIYVHPDAPIIIDGTIETNGLKDTADRVYFTGDRLDEPYKNYPATWPGIYFSTSSGNNVLNYTVIKNSYQSIAVLDPSPNPPTPKLVLNECVIDNSYDYGIVASNSSISARNCQISNCGKNVALFKGGTYTFTHCTVASYSNPYIQHTAPVLIVTNFDATGAQPLDALFRNCIFWGENGTVDTEVVVVKSIAALFSARFDQVLWKVPSTPADATIILPAPTNLPPQFDSIDVARRYYNFRLKDTSPALNKGKNFGVSIDLDGKPRPVGVQPDLGCFEKQ